MLYFSIQEEGGIIDLNWCGDLLYPYCMHFNDSNPSYRSGSLIVIWGLLIEWDDGSGFLFYIGIEEYVVCHDFEKYLEEYLKSISTIHHQHPNISYVIEELLIKLDKENGFETVFPNTSVILFHSMRKKIFQNSRVKSNEVYKNAFKEAGSLLN